MKIKILKLLLILVSLVPITSVQVAAQSRLTDLDGEEQQDEFRQRIATARELLFPNNELNINRAAILKNLRRSLNTDDPVVLEEVLDQNVLILLDNGLVDWDERNVLSRTPSIWGAR